MSSGTPPTDGSSTPPNPLLVPPPGGWLDLDEEPINARAALLVGPVTAFYILALGAIGLRIWAKNIKKASYRLSDYAVFVAAFFGTGYIAICWIAVERGGLGFPLIQVPPPARIITRKLFFVAWLVQCYANTCVRLSILDFILQVFSIKKFRTAVYFFQAITIAYMVACTIAWLATCRPFKYNYELSPTAILHCGNLKLKFLLSAIFNLVLDVGILILPMPMLWTLQLNTRKKVALSVVFGLGIFVCFATAWRTYHVVKFSRPQNQMNFTVAIVEDALWSGLEITLGIINACLPVIPPAAQRILNIPVLRLLTFNSSRNTGKNSKLSTGNSSVSNNSRVKSSWVRLGSTKDESRVGIEREVEFSVDIESESAHHMIPMDNMSTTKLAEKTHSYHNPNPLTNQYGSGNRS